MNTRCLPALLVLVAAVCLFPVTAAAHGCLKCHQEHNVVIEVADPGPISFMVDGQKVTLTLADAFAFHGHECPGVTIAFLAIRHGLGILCGDDIPDRNDLMIAVRTPARGPLDMIDLIMKGDDPAKRTWPPDGIPKTGDGFWFTIVRKSTCEIIDVRLKPGLFPKDFFKLKKKQKNKKISVEEWNRLHDYMSHIITQYPVMSQVALFGSPKPYKAFWWGALEKGEFDRTIRNLRREQKRKKP